MSGNQGDCSWADLLKVHHDNMATGHAILDRGQQVISMKIYSLTEEVERLTVQVGAGFNATIGDLATELYVLKGRQAASAALQVIQFLLFAGYLVALAVNYVVKKCRKHSKKRGEKRGKEKVELLEQRLQERKSRRRAAAARQSSADK